MRGGFYYGTTTQNVENKYLPISVVSFCVLCMNTVGWWGGGGGGCRRGGWREGGFKYYNTSDTSIIARGGIGRVGGVKLLKILFGYVHW